MSAPPPPPPPVDPGYHAGDRLDAIPLASVGTLLGIATITTALRIFWRIKPIWRIGADDITLVFALALTISWYGVDAAMYHHGRGLEGAVLDPWTVGPLIVADGVLWVWALCIIRISVALMLLRLKESRWWKSVLWTVIGVQICMLIVGTTMHLVMCRPLSARWAPTGTPPKECIEPAKFMIYGYVYSAFTIASDLTLSLLPITFIHSLTRPVHEKVLIGCLMAAGLAATGVAIARLFLIMGYVPVGTKGPVVSMLQDLLWGFELTIGILTASMPALKAPVHRVLLSWGLLPGSKSSSDMSPESFLDHLTNGSHVTRQMRRWDPSVRDPPDMYTLQKGPTRDLAGSETYLGSNFQSTPPV
ncbi:hypothetical protein QBC37DRAFT_35374 [Rhypophila decipiens]|uniref:Rhodopsin domain-containing protein n=1 Tax=Rhypophila decipiens TaxID=261697 RepID=A0AAN6Y2Y2_9PEZI|nr:hypothetical protein QBC37DRAFT_35374 [Rhypophila decipiens]